VTIADRAASANTYVQEHSTHPLISPRPAADVARAAVRLAALLGIDPVHVRPDHSWNHLARPLAPLTQASFPGSRRSWKRSIPAKGAGLPCGRSMCR
jgi:hypothetical protein